MGGAIGARGPRRGGKEVKGHGVMDSSSSRREKQGMSGSSWTAGLFMKATWRSPAWRVMRRTPGG